MKNKKLSKILNFILKTFIKVMILLLIYHMAVDFIDTSKIFIKNIFTQKNQVVLLAIILYLLSLALPAFGFYHRPINSGKGHTSAKSGLEVLVFGTILGWASIIFKGNYGAIAVYANYLFFYNIIVLINNPNITLMVTSVTMVMLALQSFYYRDSNGEIPSPLGERVRLWGWGAVFWFYAQFIVLSLTFSIFSTLSIMPIWGYIIIFIIILSVLIAYKRNKYSKANEFEKRAYFPKWVALTTYKLSNYAYNPPINVTVNSKSIIKLGNRIKLKETNLRLSTSRKNIATPRQFVYEDEFYKVFNLRHIGYSPIARILPTQPYDMQYNVYLKKGVLTYSLLDNTGKNIWTAETKIGEVEGIPPKYDSDLYELFSPLIIKNKYEILSKSLLEKALGKVKFDFATFSDFSFLVDANNPKCFYLMDHKFYYYDFNKIFSNPADLKKLNNRNFGLGLSFWHTDNFLVLSNTYIRLIQEKDSEIAIVFFALMFDKNSFEPLFELKLDNGSANIGFEKGLLEKLEVVNENMLVQKQTIFNDIFESTDKLEVINMRFGFGGRKKHGFGLVEFKDLDDAIDLHGTLVLETSIGDFALSIG